MTTWDSSEKLLTHVATILIVATTVAVTVSISIAVAAVGWWRWLALRGRRRHVGLRKKGRLAR